MLLNLGKQFLGKAIYGVLGGVGLGLAKPDAIITDGDAPEGVLWKAVLMGAFTGAIAAFNRWRTWDKKKANGGE